MHARQTHCKQHSAAKLTLQKTRKGPGEHESAEWKRHGRNWREERKGENHIIQYSYMIFSKTKYILFLKKKRRKKVLGTYF